MGFDLWTSIRGLNNYLAQVRRLSQSTNSADLLFVNKMKDLLTTFICQILPIICAYDIVNR